MAQVEVITGTSRRRRYTEAEKLEIIAEASMPGVFARDVMRARDVPASSFYMWCKQYRTPMQKKVVAKPESAVGNGFTALVPIRDEHTMAVIEVDVKAGLVRVPLTISPELATAVIRAMVQR